MPLEALAAALPPYAGDLARNLAVAAQDTRLTDQQRWGCFVACAAAVATPVAVQAIEVAARDAGLDVDALAAARGAAAIMAQNNVYFRALTLLKTDYKAMRSGLFMRIVTHPGVPADDFDLWCVAVSAIYGCPDCLNAHEAPLRARGVGAGAILAALRIAAVVHGVSRVLAAEAALAGA